MAKKGGSKGTARRAKVDRRKKRERQKRATQARTAARREKEEAVEEEAELEELEPLSPLFAEEGPLASIRFDLSEMPEDEPGADTAGAIAGWYFERLPRLASEEWRARAEVLLSGLRAALPAIPDAPPSSPAEMAAAFDADREALSGALHWLDPALASGVGAYHNTFFRFVFDRSAEAAFLDGALPAWVADALSISTGAVREALLERAHDRLSQRITLGHFQDDLPPDEMPSAAAMLSGPPLEPSRFAQEASAAAEKDMTPERRAVAAKRLRDSAAHERAEGRALLAFDLDALARALGSQDPVDQGLVRLYYARSVYRRRENATSSTSEWPLT